MMGFVYARFGEWRKVSELAAAAVINYHWLLAQLD